jgi:hypothetical protein
MTHLPALLRAHIELMQHQAMLSGGTCPTEVNVVMERGGRVGDDIWLFVKHFRYRTVADIRVGGSMGWRARMLTAPPSSYQRIRERMSADTLDEWMIDGAGELGAWQLNRRATGPQRLIMDAVSMDGSTLPQGMVNPLVWSFRPAERPRVRTPVARVPVAKSPGACYQLQTDLRRIPR